MACHPTRFTIGHEVVSTAAPLGTQQAVEAAQQSQLGLGLPEGLTFQSLVQ